MLYFAQDIDQLGPVFLMKTETWVPSDTVEASVMAFWPRCIESPTFTEPASGRVIVPSGATRTLRSRSPSW